MALSYFLGIVTVIWDSTGELSSKQKPEKKKKRERTKIWLTQIEIPLKKAEENKVNSWKPKWTFWPKEIFDSFLK